jgi:predicted DNA-binding protein
VDKTSVYLGSKERERLAQLARREGISQAEVIRRAIASYAPPQPSGRDFALAGVAAGDGTSWLALPEDDLLAGFGS